MDQMVKAVSVIFGVVLLGIALVRIAEIRRAGNAGDEQAEGGDSRG